MVSPRKKISDFFAISTIVPTLTHNETTPAPYLNLEPHIKALLENLKLIKKNRFQLKKFLDPNNAKLTNELLTLCHPILTTKLPHELLSDHALQQIKAALKSDSGIAWERNIGTLNVLAMCHSNNGSRSYANNPFYIDETPEQYAARSLLQLRYLAAWVKTQSIDFLMLQEAEFYHTPLVSQWLIPLLFPSYKSFATADCKTLLNTTDKPDKIRHLVTLYQADRQTVVHPGVFYAFSDNKIVNSVAMEEHWGLARTFKLIEGAKTYGLALVHVHGKYQRSNYDQDIAHLIKLLTPDISLIFGGDWNTVAHSPQVPVDVPQIASLITPAASTNICSHTVYDNGKEVYVDSLQYLFKDQLYPTSIDGFVLCPQQSYTMAATTNFSGFEKTDAGNYRLVPAPVTQVVSKINAEHQLSWSEEKLDKPVPKCELQ